MGVAQASSPLRLIRFLDDKAGVLGQVLACGSSKTAACQCSMQVDGMCTLLMRVVEI